MIIPRIPRRVTPAFLWRGCWHQVTARYQIGDKQAFSGTCCPDQITVCSQNVLDIYAFQDRHFRGARTRTQRSPLCRMEDTCGGSEVRGLRGVRRSYQFLPGGGPGGGRGGTSCANPTRTFHQRPPREAWTAFLTPLRIARPVADSRAFQKTKNKRFHLSQSYAALAFNGRARRMKSSSGTTSLGEWENSPGRTPRRTKSQESTWQEYG